MIGAERRHKSLTDRQSARNSNAPLVVWRGLDLRRYLFSEVVGRHISAPKDPSVHESSQAVRCYVLAHSRCCARSARD
jgi:hypothetical protein